MEDELVIDLKGIIQTLKQHVLIIGLVALLCGAAGYSYSKFVIVPQYQASAMMIINNTKAVGSTTMSNADVAAAKSLADTYSVIIKSDAVLQPVIERMHLTLNSDSLARKITVSAVNDTQIIKITLRDASPQLAAQVVDEILKVTPDIIVDKVEASSCKIISNAKASGPVSPNVKKNTLMALAAGLGVMVLFFVLREILDDTVRSEEQLAEIMGVPNLGVIYKSQALLEAEKKRKH